MQPTVIEVTGLSSKQIQMLEEIITAFRAVHKEELINYSSERIGEQSLIESAEIYAEIYQEEPELKELTESALMA